MNCFSKYKRRCKILVLFVTFTLLSISIMKSALNIYARASANDTICVPILMYHQVKNSDLGKDVISPYEFESDLQYLSENNYTTITMSDLINYVYEGKELPQNPIILSFDDGYLSTYKNVFPLLEKYKMKIVLSIVGKGIDDFTNKPDDNINYAHVTWGQVFEMEESGLVDIQNHSYNLHKVCNGRYGCNQKTNESFSQYKEFIAQDIMTLQNEIESVTDTTPNTFAYPFGKYNDNTDAILKELGFKATLSVTYGVNLIDQGNPDCLYELKRICRSHNQGIGKLIKEGMATIH